MSIVTISMGSLIGGKNLADCLTARLGYRYLDFDTLIRKSATGRVSEFDLAAALEEPPLFTSNHRRYVYLALIQAALTAEVQQGNIVYHGLAGHLLLKGVPGLLRLRIVAPYELRIRMASQRFNFSRSEAIAYIDKVDRDRRRWAQFIYGVDWGDPALYDLVINLELVTIEEACSAVVAIMGHSRFQCGPECQLLMANLALSSRIRAQLTQAPDTLHLQVEVECKGGAVTIKGDCLEEKTEAIHRIVEAIPGVAAVEVQSVSL